MVFKPVKMLNSYKTSFFTLLFGSFLQISCEGAKCTDGTVLDAVTGKSLDNVSVMVLSGKKIMYTDSSGKFSVCNKVSSCMSGKCKQIVVQFSKNGYRSVTLDNPEKGILVRLEMSRPEIG